MQSPEEISPGNGITFFPPNEKIHVRKQGDYSEFESKRVHLGELGDAFLHAENEGNSLLVAEDDLVVFVKANEVFVGKAEDMDPEDEPYLVSIQIEPKIIGVLIAQLNISNFSMNLEAPVEPVDDPHATFSESFSLLGRWKIISRNAPEYNPHWLFVQKDPRILSQMYFSFSNR